MLPPTIIKEVTQKYTIRGRFQGLFSVYFSKQYRTVVQNKHITTINPELPNTDTL